MNAAGVIAEIVPGDGTFPNNERLRVLIYRNAIEVSGDDTAEDVERRFRRNGWGGTWRNGIYSHHHYHSTAHEVLGVARGTARLQLGGEKGTADRSGAAFGSRDASVCYVDAAIGRLPTA